MAKSSYVLKLNGRQFLLFRDLEYCIYLLKNILTNIFFIFSMQASDNLLKLAEDPKVQHFLNNVPMKESMSDKDIYQPGSLRKVNNTLHASN